MARSLYVVLLVSAWPHSEGSSPAAAPRACYVSPGDALAEPEPKLVADLPEFYRLRPEGLGLRCAKACYHCAHAADTSVCSAEEQRLGVTKPYHLFVESGSLDFLKSQPDVYQGLEVCDTDNCNAPTAETCGAPAKAAEPVAQPSSCYVTVPETPFHWATEPVSLPAPSTAEGLWLGGALWGVQASPVNPVQCARMCYQCEHDYGSGLCSEKEKGTGVTKPFYLFADANMVEWAMSRPDLYRDVLACAADDCNAPVAGLCAPEAVELEPAAKAAATGLRGAPGSTEGRKQRKTVYLVAAGLLGLVTLVLVGLAVYWRACASVAPAPEAPLAPGATALPLPALAVGKAGDSADCATPSTRSPSSASASPRSADASSTATGGAGSEEDGHEATGDTGDATDAADEGVTGVDA